VKPWSARDLPDSLSGICSATTQSLGEGAVTGADLLRSPVDLKTLESTHYNHGEWFFGVGAHPKWLGYTLGYQMVGRWLASVGEIDAATWINVPADDIVASALEEGIVVL